MSEESAVPGAPLGDSVGALLITDPLGRRTGFDVPGGLPVNDIPQSSYHSELIEDPTEEGIGAAWKILEISGPMNGVYRLKVQGIGKGKYSISIRGHNPKLMSSSWESQEIPISRDIVHTYALAFNGASQSPLETTGGYDGGGEGIPEVDQLLSYATVARDTIRISEAATVALLVFYAKTIQEGSFEAVSSGTNISHLFKPVAGGYELVEVPVHAGENELVLSVDGTLHGRVNGHRDIDRFIIVVDEKTEGEGTDH